MKIDGNKWIYFELIKETDKTQVWDVINKSSEEPLARIYWYYQWRQYVISPEPNTVYNDGCLDTIIKFMKRLNIEKKLIEE
jgi:hypothetical protein